MAQMLKQYQMLLESIVSDSDQRISELSLLTQAERHQILVEWNDTAADYPEEQVYPHVVRDQGQRTHLRQWRLFLAMSSLVTTNSIAGRINWPTI